jgi:hypothetical protein
LIASGLVSSASDITASPPISSSSLVTRSICSGVATPLRYSSSTVRASAAKPEADADLDQQIDRRPMGVEALVQRCARWQSDDLPLWPDYVLLPLRHRCVSHHVHPSFPISIIGRLSASRCIPSLPGRRK